MFSLLLKELIFTFYLIQDMAEKSAESYVSRKDNDTAILILPNVIKVMVVLKRAMVNKKHGKI